MVKVKKSLALVLALVLGAGCLTACEKKETLKVYNWGEYIADGVKEDFEKKYNCRVVYETYDSNEAMMAKVQNMGKNSYDVIFPSDYTVTKMIKLDMLHELNYDNIPNLRYIDEKYLGGAYRSYDPEGKYSVPYMANTLGILYNTDMVDEPITSIGALFDDQYAGQVFMLDGMRDSLGMALVYLGYSMNTTDPAEIAEARDLLMAQKKNVLAYIGDDVRDKMVAGEAAMALVFTGEGNKALSESDRLAMVAVPEEGSNLAIDTMVILKNSQHIELAEAFINFMLEPDIAQRNAEATGYTSPHTEAIARLDASISGDPNYYPSDEALARCEIFTYLTEEEEKLYSDAWTKIKNY